MYRLRQHQSIQNHQHQQIKHLQYFEELKKEVDNLKKILELQQRTIAHDRQHFGQQYEMT